MKKLILAISVIAMMGCFASCSKNCTCTKYLNGEKTGTTEISKDKLPEGKKCSDLNTIVTIGGKKNGMECR